MRILFLTFILLVTQPAFGFDGPERDFEFPEPVIVEVGGTRVDAIEPAQIERFQAAFHEGGSGSTGGR